MTNKTDDVFNVKPTAIETQYAGHLFRSRLEARWAVFFNFMGIPWLYEPEGFFVNGRPYLPDFYLPECGTWVEVKGISSQVDMELMHHAAMELPVISDLHPSALAEERRLSQRGLPRVAILGNIPTPKPSGDYGWVGLDGFGAFGGCVANEHRYGFGNYFDAHAMSVLYVEGNDPVTPVLCDGGYASNYAQLGYAAARSARFEHGHSGATL
jgi:hypothetical protein